MFLKTKFTIFVSFVKMDLGHFNIFLFNRWHDAKLCSQRMLQRKCRRKRTLLLSLVCLLDRFLWHLWFSLVLTPSGLATSPVASPCNSCDQQLPPASTLDSSVAECFTIGHLPMNSFPWHPRGLTSSKFQRIVFQRALPAWHHSDFSAIQWATAVPFPSRLRSQSWSGAGTLPWVFYLSWTGASCSFYVLFSYVL